MPSNTLLSDSNQKWILGGATLLVTLTLSLGGMVTSSQQAQIDKNQERIWSLQSTAVTEDKLDRQIKQVQDYIDVRIQSLESSQRSMATQISILVEDSKEGRKETRDALESIRESLASRSD